jgi:tRNA-(ms[2]io[6]A)-hydroxylase
MLGLLSPTLPTWVEAVERDLDRLLQDHAHCELKAAQSALSLAARFGGEAPELVAPLLALAKEETEHVSMVHERLQARGSHMSLPDQDDYVVLLRRAANEDRGAIPPLLDRLLVSALVEARSCERFKLLSEKLGDATLRAFYKDLMASEARHYRMFAAAAEGRFGESEARARFGVLAAREAGIVGHLPLGPTVHG